MDMTRNHKERLAVNNQNGKVPMTDQHRVVVFIDGSNLYHSLEENCRRADLDFELFAYKLAGGRPLFRTYYYNIAQDADRKPDQHKEQQKFLASLYAVPRMELRLGTQKMRGDQFVEKGVDIMLATDLLRYAWEDMYDVAILVSGDADFTYAVSTVKSLGKHLEVAAFPSNLAWELANAADDRHFLDEEYFKDLWVGNKRTPTRGRRRKRPARRGGGSGEDV